jgi:hypothetical protein
MIYIEEFEDTNVVIRSRKLKKDRHIIFKTGSCLVIQ